MGKKWATHVTFIQFKKRFTERDFPGWEQVSPMPEGTACPTRAFNQKTLVLLASIGKNPARDAVTPDRSPPEKQQKLEDGKQLGKDPVGLFLGFV